MKRIVILIDGTWDDINAHTSVAKLNVLIKNNANGTAQKVLQAGASAAFSPSHSGPLVVRL
jgi:hypothetical protein